jgi:thiamine kinase-like enzyme
MASQAALALVTDARSRIQRPFELLAKAEVEQRFCRPDCRFANFLDLPGGRVAMVDWEDAGLEDPACVVADLLLHAEQEDLMADRHWVPFLQPYVEAMSVRDRTIAERIELNRPLAAIFWFVLLLHQAIRRRAGGTLDRWEVNALPGLVRLRRYLAIALAWPAHDAGRVLGEIRQVEFFRSE